jgi:deoxyribodipyrimidine photo-lyase
MPVTLLWFRRDLRLGDNSALAAAVERGQVVPVFVLDPHLLGGRAPRREAWLSANLAALAADLRRARCSHDRVRCPAPRARRGGAVWNRDYAVRAGGTRRSARLPRPPGWTWPPSPTAGGAAAVKTRSGGFTPSSLLQGVVGVPASAPCPHSASRPGHPPGLDVAAPDGRDCPARGWPPPWRARALRPPGPGRLPGRARSHGCGDDVAPVVLPRLGVVSPRQIRAAVVAAGREDQSTPRPDLLRGWPGASSSSRSCGVPQSLRRSPRGPPGIRGARTRRGCAHGRKGVPGIPWSTRACGSWPRPATCPIARAW